MDNIEKNDYTTPKSLISFMIATSFKRIMNSDLVKLENLKQSFKQMLAVERKKHPGKDEMYDELDKLLDDFFEYIKDPTLMKEISEGKISKNELEEKALAEVANIPKRKYDMSDLYRSGLIAPSLSDTDERQVILNGRKGETYAYYDKLSRPIYITDVGKVVYREWNGIAAEIYVYLIQKQKEDGNLSQDLVCSNISIPMMEDPEYREAVLEELLSDDNIKKSNAGAYIGQIDRRKKANSMDKLHAERQNANEYSYRINDKYVLVYDATELSAVIEVIKKYGPRIKARLGKKNETNSELRRKTQSAPDDYDGHGGR